jgi:hypothetical protein
MMEIALAGSDLAKSGGGERGGDWAAGIEVVDHVELGTAHCGREARKIAALCVERQAGAVEPVGQSVCRLAQFAASPLDHGVRQIDAYWARAWVALVRVVRRGGTAGIARNRLGWSPRLMAMPRKPAEPANYSSRMHELALGADSDDAVLGSCCLMHLLNSSPSGQLQNNLEDANVLAHGIDLLGSDYVSERRKPKRINAVQLLKRKSYWIRRERRLVIHGFAATASQVVGHHPPSPTLTR